MMKADLPAGIHAVGVADGRTATREALSSLQSDCFFAHPEIIVPQTPLPMLSDPRKRELLHDIDSVLRLFAPFGLRTSRKPYALRIFDASADVTYWP